jgi:hypothetical protein
MKDGSEQEAAKKSALPCPWGWDQSRQRQTAPDGIPLSSEAHARLTLMQRYPLGSDTGLIENSCTLPPSFAQQRLTLLGNDMGRLLWLVVSLWLGLMQLGRVDVVGGVLSLVIDL